MVHTYVVKYSVIKGVAAAAACQSCRLMNIMAYALECDSAIKLNSTLALWLAGESSMAGVFQCNLMGKRMIVFVHLRAAEIILILQQIGSVHQFKSHQWEVSRAPAHRLLRIQSPPERTSEKEFNQSRLCFVTVVIVQSTFQRYIDSYLATNVDHYLVIYLLCIYLSLPRIWNILRRPK